MAEVFFLGVECGRSQEAAEAVASHFRNQILSLSDGSRIVLGADLTSFDEAWWAGIVPVGETDRSQDTDSLPLTEVSLALYERLRSAPPYRYALAGIEVLHFRSFHEFDEGDFYKSACSGLVLSEPVWQHFGAPTHFCPFSPGYRWNPFKEVR